MVFINEWLPNPTGSDISGEWIELFNSGPEAASLDGWSLKTANGQKFVLKNYEISAESYLVLKRNETKLVLHNKDETIFLYNENKQLIDKSEFYGSAPEGESFSRITGGNNLGWLFTEPTPGQMNKFNSIQSSAENNYPWGQPLNPRFSPTDFWLLLFSCALSLSAVAFFLLKKDENTSKLFFGGDQEVR